MISLHHCDCNSDVYSGGTILRHRHVLSRALPRKARMCERRVSRDRESSPLSRKLHPSLSSLSRLTFPRTVIPSPPFRIESSGMVGRYALRGSGRKAAESSLALEGAFNWIRLIRLNSPSLTSARAPNSPI